MNLFDFFSDSQREPSSGDLRRIEKKLDMILNHLGLEYQPFTERVRLAADGGKKIEAIKLYREETGVGLVQAKEDVEAYMRDTRNER